MAYIPKTTPPAGKYYYTAVFNPFFPYWSPPRLAGNCTWYAFGRFSEVLGEKAALCLHDAQDWYAYKDGYQRGQTPKEGAVLCYAGGRYSGLGHVAVVEEVYSDGSVLVSESGYNAFVFRTNRIANYKNYDGYTFQGFIYNPKGGPGKPEPPKKRTITDVYNPDAALTIVQAVRAGQACSNIILGTGISEDGVDGPATRANAVKMVQWALNKDYGAGLAIDGAWGAKTEKAFGGHYVERGETQYMVTALEVLLLLAGYNPHGVEIPGTFGEKLKAAVGAYQKDNGLARDYVAGYATFKKLALQG